jgi:ribosomal protein S18 acetylase RimI-like enzyme
MTESATRTPHRIRPMTMADYDAVIGLLKQTPGVSLRDADLRESTERYLLRNPGLRFVAEDAETGSVVGCILSGHDGRRGYLQRQSTELRLHPLYEAEG